MTNSQFDLFLAKIEALTTSCWKWSANRFSNGYGQVTQQQKKRLAHRVSYEHFIGEIPEGLDLDHLCRNRWCVNPTHLEPVSHRENLMRGRGPLVQQRRHAASRRATHCKRGHAWDEANTRVYYSEYHHAMQRTCRACEALMKSARKVAA